MMPTPPLYRLIYISRSTIDPPCLAGEVDRILGTSRVSNHLAAISGILLASRGHFCQVIEGTLTHVERLFETIQRDPRHRDIAVMEFVPVPKRVFDHWEMAFLDIDCLTSDRESLGRLAAAASLSLSGRSMVDAFARLTHQRAAFGD